MTLPEAMVIGLFVVVVVIGLVLILTGGKR